MISSAYDPLNYVDDRESEEQDHHQNDSAYTTNNINSAATTNTSTSHNYNHNDHGHALLSGGDAANKLHFNNLIYENEDDTIVQGR